MIERPALTSEVIFARLSSPWNDADESDFLRTCQHEAGHFVVADCFKLEPSSFIAHSRCGATTYLLCSAPQTASIGWAGTVAELLAGYRDPARPTPAIPVTETFRWWQEFMDSRCHDRMSLSDREAVAVDGYSCDSLCVAANTLLANRAALAATAQRFTEDFRDIAITFRRRPADAANSVHAWVESEAGQTGGAHV